MNAEHLNSINTDPIILFSVPGQDSPEQPIDESSISSDWTAYGVPTEVSKKINAQRHNFLSQDNVSYYTHVNAFAQMKPARAQAFSSNACEDITKCIYRQIFNGFSYADRYGVPEQVRQTVIRYLHLLVVEAANWIASGWSSPDKFTDFFYGYMKSLIKDDEVAQFLSGQNRDDLLRRYMASMTNGFTYPQQKNYGQTFEQVLAYGIRSLLAQQRLDDNITLIEQPNGEMQPIDFRLALKDSSGNPSPVFFLNIEVKSGLCGEFRLNGKGKPAYEKQKDGTVYSVNWKEGCYYGDGRSIAKELNDAAAYAISEEGALSNHMNALTVYFYYGIMPESGEDDARLVPQLLHIEMGAWPEFLCQSTVQDIESESVQTCSTIGYNNSQGKVMVISKKVERQTSTEQWMRDVAQSKQNQEQIFIPAAIAENEKNESDRRKKLRAIPKKVKALKETFARRGELLDVQLKKCNDIFSAGKMKLDAGAKRFPGVYSAVIAFEKVLNHQTALQQLIESNQFREVLNPEGESRSICYMNSLTDIDVLEAFIADSLHQIDNRVSELKHRFISVGVDLGEKVSERAAKRRG